MLKGTNSTENSHNLLLYAAWSNNNQ